MRFSPSCGCCGGEPSCDETDTCGDYVASDGNEYSDDFTDLSGWTDDSNGATMSATGGRCRGEYLNAFAYGKIYRTASLTEACLHVIAEVQIYKSASTPPTSSYMGLWIVNPYNLGASTDGWGVTANTDGSGNWLEYRALISGSTAAVLTPTPADGDKVTISVRKTTNGLRFCIWINETLSYDSFSYIDADVSLPGDVDYGLECTTSDSGTYFEWDNFSIHAGNP